MKLHVTSFLVEDIGDLKGGFNAACISLAKGLLRYLLNNDMRHVCKDKLAARNYLVCTEVEHPYIALGISLAAKGDELTCPWDHMKLSVVALIATA